VARNEAAATAAAAAAMAAVAAVVAGPVAGPVAVETRSDRDRIKITGERIDLQLEIGRRRTRSDHIV